MALLNPKQGPTYGDGVFARNTGATNLCLHLLQIPPGGRASAQLRARHETALYLISGKAIMLRKPGLAHRLAMRPGDYVYIPPNVPHLPVNPSASETAVAVLARTDPREQESVVLLYELDAVAG